MPEFDEGLLRYLTAREEQHQRETTEAWPKLERDVEAFMAAHPGDPGLPKLMARLIREAAVAAFVRGTMHAGGTSLMEVVIPPDPVIVAQALETCRSMDYAGFRIFDGHGGEGADDA